MATTQNARPDDDAADSQSAETQAAEAATPTARRPAQTAPLRFDEDDEAADEAKEAAPTTERAVGESAAQSPASPLVAADEWWASSAPSEGEPSGTTTTAIVAPLAPAPGDEPIGDKPAPGNEPIGDKPAPGDEPIGDEPPSDEPIGDEPPSDEPASDEPIAPRQVSRREQGTQLLGHDALPALSRVHSSQGLAAMAARDIGRVRSANQDSVFSLLTNLPREGGDVPMGLFIVADGMGGHEGGEIASRLAVRTVVHHVLAQLLLPALDDGEIEALQQLMITAVQEANSVIWEQAQAQGTDMGTTCTAVLMMGHGLYIAHVGDSRAYLYEQAGLRLLTTDHSTVGRLIALGHLDPSEAREHPLRNQLYRTVGQQPQISVDFVYQPAASGTHLLLCSDGLWGLIDDPLMAKALQNNLWPQDACNELIALANLAGGEDNISAVVVSLPVVVDDQGRTA
jgi:PPM family protein phosphatase